MKMIRVNIQLPLPIKSKLDALRTQGTTVDSAFIGATLQRQEGGITHPQVSVNFKQFRQPANGHNRTARVNGRIVGGRGFRLMSKIGQQAISLHRLE